MEQVMSKGLWRKEIFWTSVFSAIAVIVSGIGIYLPLKEVDEVSMRLVDFDVSADQGSTAVSKIVFINGGNVPYLISEVRVVASLNGTKNPDYVADKSSLASNAPFVLEGKKMEVVEVAIPAGKMFDSKRTDMPVYVGVQVTTVDINGIVRHSTIWYAGACLRSEMLVDSEVSRKPSRLKQTDEFLLDPGRGPHCQ